MTPEVIARVDAWLAKNAQRCRGIGGVSAAILSLGSAWACATHNGAVTDPGDVAAATGILLALVREAWGPDVDIEFHDGHVYPDRHLFTDGSRACVIIVWQSNNRRRKRLWGCTRQVPAEALAACLEAAPAKEAR